MPDYEALAKQGIYTVAGDRGDIRVFAGTVADPFFIDLGAAFDTFNFRTGAGGGVLTPAQDKDDHLNLAPNAVSGFNVNTIAIEVPIAYLTSDGNQHKATDPKATIGTWATTSRAQFTVRHPPSKRNAGQLAAGAASRQSVDQRTDHRHRVQGHLEHVAAGNDAKFANFDLDPTLARVLNAAYGINIPAPPRTDLLPLVDLRSADCRCRHPGGPGRRFVAAQHRCSADCGGNRKRMGLLAGDGAGFPNGRRVTDDVVDIAARAVAGVLNPKFNVAPNNLIGDGVSCRRCAHTGDFPVCALRLQRPRQPSHRPQRDRLRGSANAWQQHQGRSCASQPGRQHAPALSCNLQTCRGFPGTPPGSPETFALSKGS